MGIEPVGREIVDHRLYIAPPAIDARVVHPGALGDHRQRHPLAAALRNEFLDGFPDRGEDRRTTAARPSALLCIRRHSASLKHRFVRLSRPRVWSPLRPRSLL